MVIFILHVSHCLIDLIHFYIDNYMYCHNNKARPMMATLSGIKQRPIWEELCCLMTQHS